MSAPEPLVDIRQQNVDLEHARYVVRQALKVLHRPQTVDKPYTFEGDGPISVHFSVGFARAALTELLEYLEKLP